VQLEGAIKTAHPKKTGAALKYYTKNGQHNCKPVDKIPSFLMPSHSNAAGENQERAL
jgi:hypothetical protein